MGFLIMKLWEGVASAFRLFLVSFHYFVKTSIFFHPLNRNDDLKESGVGVGSRSRIHRNPRKTRSRSRTSFFFFFFFFFFFNEWEHRTGTMCPFSSLHPSRNGKERQ